MLSRMQAASRDSVAAGEGSHMQNEVKTLDNGDVREEDREEESEDEQVVSAMHRIAQPLLCYPLRHAQAIRSELNKMKIYSYLNLFYTE